MKLILPLLLLSTWPAHSQPTSPVPTPSTAPAPSGRVCLEARQAAVIDAALTRFELLKQASVEQSGAYHSLLAGHVQDSLLLVSHARLLAWYQTAYGQEQQLRQAAATNLQISQRKANRRGLLAVAEALLLTLVAYTLITN